MQTNFKQIIHNINQQKVLKFTQLPRLTKKNVEVIVKKSFNVLKRKIQNRKNKTSKNLWNYTWASTATAKRKRFRKHKPIKYIEYNLTNLIQRLQKSRPLEIRYTYNTGANYREFTRNKKKNLFYDFINVPCIKRFRERKYFYKTLLHELFHCIMHRLGWTNILCLTDDEEVTVELCSMIICFVLGLNTWNESLKYIGDYITNRNGNLIHRGRQEYILKASTKILQYVFVCK